MTMELNINELAKQLRAKRGTRGLRAVAQEIGDISASTLSRVEQGKIPDLDTFLRLCRWLGASPDQFTSATRETPEDKDRDGESTQQTVIAHLRADRTLDPATAEALARMIEMAYAAAERGEIGQGK